MLNDTYGLELSEEDKVELNKMRQRVVGIEELMSFFNADNSRDAVSSIPIERLFYNKRIQRVLLKRHLQKLLAQLHGHFPCFIAKVSGHHHPFILWRPDYQYRSSILPFCLCLKEKGHKDFALNLVNRIWFSNKRSPKLPSPCFSFMDRRNNSSPLTR